jgi:hypothetical protein
VDGFDPVPAAVPPDAVLAACQRPHRLRRRDPLIEEPESFLLTT